MKLSDVIVEIRVLDRTPPEVDAAVKIDGSWAYDSAGPTTEVALLDLVYKLARRVRELESK